LAVHVFSEEDLLYNRYTIIVEVYYGNRLRQKAGGLG
jgi:hypothetical protein